MKGLHSFLSVFLGVFTSSSSTSYHMGSGQVEALQVGDLALALALAFSRACPSPGVGSKADG